MGNYCPVPLCITDDAIDEQQQHTRVILNSVKQTQTIEIPRERALSPSWEVIGGSKSVEQYKKI